MKKFSLLAVLLLAAAGSLAQQASGRSPESEPTAEEIQTIRKILELPPERLTRMRSAIEKMERMSPESRREFAANLAKYETATPEELSPAEAKAERSRIQALTTEQRMEFLRKLAEKYGPEIDKEKGKSSDAKEAEKKRRKLAEGEVPATPGAAPKQ